MAQGSGRVGQAAAAFAANARNPALRRAQLSFLGAWTAEWAFTVGLGIVAYRDGGATAVGLVGLLRMVPSAVLTPLLAPVADRGRRQRVLVLVSTVRGAATAGAAVVVGTGGPSAVVYALAVVSTVAATLYRPAHSALLPSLCRTGHGTGRRERGARPARLAGHPARPAAGRGAARLGRGDGRVRRLGRRLRLGGAPAGAAALRGPTATARPGRGAPRR
ncbi:hypothetical protein [Geodermatophilus sp. FMUSA9-8]|uniref:hypothetical protein n=1 Tax=Geodermatophilus sp. FMUSA9-8 TaxID=3120155 RepID=UPI00300AD579